MTPTGAVPRGPLPPRTPSLLLGIGLGGFVDGIVLHQILQWHHLISDVHAYPMTTVAGLEANTLADGFFHVASWLCVLAGSLLALRAWRHAVWFPGRRRDRALSNILPGVTRAAAKGDMTAAAAELRVLDGMAAHFVRRHDPDAVAHQFSVLRCRGEGGQRTRPYVSSVRPLR